VHDAERTILVAPCVRIGQRLECLHGDVRREVRRERLRSDLEDAAQVRAVDVLHGEEELLRDLAELEHLHDVAVVRDQR